MKLFLYILYIVLLVSVVNAATIMVTTFDDGLSYANITGNQTKEVTVGKGITTLTANLSLNGYINPNSYTCTQNNANSTECGNTGGTISFSDLLWSNSDNMFDNNYNTYGTCVGSICSVYLNYTKPVNSFGALLEIKAGKENVSIANTINVSIPDICFQQPIVKLKYVGQSTYRFYCHNGTGYQFVLQNMPIITAISNSHYYEDKMIWNLTYNLTNPKVFMNGTQVFSYTGNYNLTNTIGLNTTAINYYLQNNATLPIRIQADSFTGSLNLYNLNITYTDFFQCAGVGSQSYNITLYDEDNQTEIYGKISVDLTVGENTLTFNKANTTSIAICTTTNNTYTVLGTIYSETTDYLHKKILVNTVMNNVTQYVNIYNSYDPTYSSLSYYLKEYNYENYADIIGRMQRYYPLNHSWITVQEDRSDEFGRLIFDIKEINTEYRFLFYSQLDALLDTTSTLKFVCVAGACDVTSIISDTPVDISTPIVSSSTYNNVTDIVTVTWNDASAATTSVNVIVNQISFTETVPICNYLSFGSSGSYNCNVTGYSGNIQSMVVSNSSLSNLQISSITYFKLEGNSTLGQLLDVHDTSESSWFSFVIIMVFVGIGLVSGSPIAVLIMVFAAIFMIGLLGLATIVDIAFLGVVGTMAMFVAMIIRRRTA